MTERHHGLTWNGDRRAAARVAWLGALGVLALMAILVRPAAARTGANLTEGSNCLCFCQCSATYCDCKTYPDGSSSCDTRCWTCTRCTNGFAGGGIVVADGRQVTLAVSATADKENKNKTTGGTGVLRWVDPDYPGGALTLESNGLNNYLILEAPNARAITGQVIVNGGPSLPFRLEAVAEPAGGVDAVSIVVGDALTGGSSGFSYTASGTLVAGDLIGTWSEPVQE